MKNDKLEFICKKCLPTNLANIEFHVTDADGNVQLKLVNQGGMEFYHISVTTPDATKNGTLYASQRTC